ncbi:MAG: nucleoside kinase, partial [Firmicutes bacterium]|nr:nucleoside kinase [Bacillota bacterium]
MTDKINLEIIDTRSRLARLKYQRTVCFLYLIVLREMMPEASAAIRYTLNNGILVELDKEISDKDVFFEKVEKRMRQLVSEKITFESKYYSRQQVLSQDCPAVMTEAQIDFVRNSEVEEVFEYSYGDYSCVFYEPLLTSAEHLKLFDLVPYEKGVIIRVPLMENPTHIPEYKDDRVLYTAYREMDQWNRLLGVSYIDDLNSKIDDSEWRDLILINEAMHEKKIAEAADRIVKENKRIILIAGPSSSGKTTFAQRLCIQLRVLGKRPLYMGTDDYFVERNMLVPDENGNFNFEDLEAVDVKLFNEHMNALLRGEVVDMPVFDFIAGSKRYGTRIIQADQDQPIVIEGIHALNDKLTEQIDNNEKFKIYISPLSPLNIDEVNRIPVTDIRLLRRMARDMRSRGRSPQDTIACWLDVRIGETKNIFPYCTSADL